jgi:hypothetical protein
VISVERVAKSKIGKVRFWVRGLAISPPNFFDFWERAFPLEFSEEKKMAGNLGLDPLLLLYRYQGTLSAFRNIFHPLTCVRIAQNRALNFVRPVNSSLLATLPHKRQLLHLPLEDDNPINDDDQALYEWTMISCDARYVYLLCFLYLT